MKLQSKLKLMAAAVALTASAGAHAAVNNFASGNSSLIFIALDNVGSPVSAVMDLGFNLDDFLAPARTGFGHRIVWNFNQNTKTVDNVLQSGDYAWSGAMAAFAGIAQRAETRWGVIAGDSLGDGTKGDVRYLTTTNAALATVRNQPKANMFNFSNIDTLFNMSNLVVDGHIATSHVTNAEGGGAATSGVAHVGRIFGNTGNWANNATFNALAFEGVAQRFYMLDTRDGVNFTRSLVTPYVNSAGAATFHYDRGVLTYLAPVPEPSAYALMLAGLGMLGFIARRRLSNRF